jgi:predicted nuclease of predicted toxin-antitoxin system
MRIVVDMNLSPRWAVRLSGLGHDAVHWSAVGDPRATDESVLAWARSEGRVIVTHDRDFPALLRIAGTAGPSVVLVRQADPGAGLLATFVSEAISAHQSALERGAVLVIDRRGARVRQLPFRR